MKFADTGEPVKLPFMTVEGIKPSTKAELAAQVTGRVIELPDDEGRSYSQFDFKEEPDSDIMYTTEYDRKYGGTATPTLPDINRHTK